MRNIIIGITAIALTGCATTPDQKQQNMDNAKMIIGTVALIAIAGAVGASQHKSKCANNRAGFYRDNVSGNVYTCP